MFDLSSKNLTKLAAAAAAVALCAGAASTANAGAYSFSNVKFDDGTVLNGTFDVNQYGYIHSWDVTSSDGAITGNHYTPSINASYNPGDTEITFNRPDYVGYLQLTLSSQLPASGSVPLVTGFGGPSFECDTYVCQGPSSDVRYIATNRDFVPSITAVPEPAAWVMMIGGLGLVGASMRRRRTAGVATVA